MIHYSTFSLLPKCLKMSKLFRSQLNNLSAILEGCPSTQCPRSPQSRQYSSSTSTGLNSIELDIEFFLIQKNLKWRCGIILFIKLKSLFSFAFVQHSFEKNLVLICNYFNYCYLKYFFPQDPSSNENQHPQAFIHFPVHVHSDNRDFQVKIKCVRKDQIGKYFRITVRERE